ncbi:MAG: lipid-A-disaccharide synthase [Magnetococcus sp. XQGC-1]
MTDNRVWKVMLVAGEASGDYLGGELLRDLKQRLPALRSMGVGGRHMRAQGLQSSFDINDLSVIGLVEVVRRLPSLLRVFNHLTNLLQREKPDLLITIDLPDFNFLLARRAKAAKIPVLHYVSPQVWAWRSGRVRSIAATVDHLLVLFPFEPAIYAQTPLPVTFVGHPLVKQAQPWRNRPQGNAGRLAVRQALHVGAEEKLVVVLPGSRQGEIKRLLSTMIQACYLLKSRVKGVRFVLALADTLTQEDIWAHWPTQISESFRQEVLIRSGATYDLVAAADVALVASGTATLEAALLETPMVVCYRVNWFTYIIGKQVIRVPFISLTNLVAGYALVKERIQNEAQPDILAADLAEILSDPAVSDSMISGFHMIKTRLAQSHRAPADVVVELLTSGTTRK